MHSSPGTPIGTGLPYASTIRIRVLSIGAPIEVGRSAVTGATIDQIVVSVGPYRFQTSPPSSSSRALTASGSVSPPHSTRMRRALRQPACSSISHVDGVACITVGRAASINSRSRPPSRADALSQITQCAPCTSGRNSSRAAISKQYVVTASSVSRACRPGRRAIDARKLVSARCVTITPFGAPVLPDV
ncbi:hypothetical protein Y023_537 [Burkholderia pseudomallei A79D]|nr:putative non-ribosomal peptide synthase [Burkholderia pseudomallei]KGD15059.1 hypothetical protein DO63_6213 [Burkholderia pseudomallei]KGY00986.1 hypothetical protein Y023_537 [Burkholderia pseudomallei A79D]KGY02019.1 hypothetical protein X997_531 [Burkholderia pseudomallei A79C]